MKIFNFTQIHWKKKYLQDLHEREWDNRERVAHFTYSWETTQFWVFFANFLSRIFIPTPLLEMSFGSFSLILYWISLKSNSNKYSRVKTFKTHRWEAAIEESPSSKLFHFTLIKRKNRKRTWLSSSLMPKISMKIEKSFSWFFGEFPNYKICGWNFKRQKTICLFWILQCSRVNFFTVYGENLP